MKKLLSLLFIMVLFAVSPVLALFCQNCGKEMAKTANFCAACGKASAGSFQTAQPVQTIQPVSTTNLPVPGNSPVVTNTYSDDASLADYESINQIELLLTNTNYGVASRQANELRHQNAGRMKVIEGNYRYFSPYRRKLHDLHVQKLNALETYLEAWKGTEYGPDRVRSMAEKDKALFLISQTNESIDTLLSGGGSLSSIANVEEMERRLQKTSANFVITAPYIMVENQRLSRGEPIWVIDVVSASAKVLHMGRGRSSQPICGWVSVYDLEKRSNWRSDPVFFYSPPTTTTIVYDSRPEPRCEPPIKVVIVGKKRYPYRHDRDRRDRHDDCDDRHDRRGDHRGHDYVVVNPRFW